MGDERKLKVGEVAMRTGLTVRTLHHWEEAGLVRPARTASGHRMYGARELERVQQVVSLRALDLSLDEIRACLDDASISLVETIDRHLEWLDGEIARKQMLRTTLRAFRRRADEHPLDVDALVDAIKESVAVEKYYTREQLETLARRAEELGEDGMQAAQQQWAELIAEFEQHMKRGTDPHDPVLEPLNARREELIRAFTGGDPEIRKNLQRVYESEPPEQASHGMMSAEVMAYMDAASRRS